MDFFATTVHDLRSARLLASPLAQVARMDRLLDELVDLSRVTSGAAALERVVFDVRVVVTDAIARHESGDATRIASHLGDEGIEIRGDPGRIGRIRDNILDNAAKYSSASAPIRVSLRVVGPEAQMRVEDRGVGIPADAQERLFTPYFRSSRTRDVPGTGLGLHISRLCLALPLAVGP
jgi:signal transduction histidine kinase